MIEKRDFPGWLALRKQLWPECPIEDHHYEMKFKTSATVHQRIGFIEINRTDTEMFFKKILP